MGTQAQCSRREHMVSTVPTMHDVVGASPISGFEPASQSRNASPIADGEGTAHRLAGMDRVEAANRGFPPEAAIRIHRRLGADEIDPMTAFTKRLHENQHRLGRARPLPITHELKDFQASESL